MPALRTSLVALAVGGAAVTTGVVATSAGAAPAPVAAVSAVAAGDTTTTTGGGTPGERGDTVRGRVRSWWSGLDDTQQQCLKDADIRRPVGPLDDAERATLRGQVEAAAQACDVELPFAGARAFWTGLSDTQQQCLRNADVTRPLGPMTTDERRQLRADLRAAAEECGVTLPVRR